MKEMESLMEETELRDKLTLDWKNVVRGYPKYSFADLMQLIFNTYWYFKKNGNQDTIPREDLKIVNNMIRFCYLPGSPIPMKESVFSAIVDTVEGLCHEIEGEGWGTYLPFSVSVGFDYHVPAGCSRPEINMNTMEDFQQSFWEEYENRAALFCEENEEWLDMVKMIKSIAHAGEDLTEEQLLFFEKYLASPEPGAVPDQYTEDDNRILEERIGKGAQSLEIHRTCLSLLDSHKNHPWSSMTKLYEMKLLSILEMLT